MTQNWNQVYLSAVKLGVELLDRKIPNWRKLIDWEKFEFSNVRSCIFGQLAYEHYKIIKKYDPYPVCALRKFLDCELYDPNYGFDTLSEHQDTLQENVDWCEAIEELWRKFGTEE